MYAFHMSHVVHVAHVVQMVQMVQALQAFQVPHALPVPRVVGRVVPVVQLPVRQSVPLVDVEQAIHTLQVVPRVPLWPIPTMPPPSLHMYFTLRRA